MMKRPTIVLLAVCVLAAGRASAQSGFNFGPDPGPQVARGSAWVARADNALATFFNPAALTRQKSGFHFGAHLMSLDRCFTRVDVNGAFVSPGGGLPAPGTVNGPDAAACMEKTPFFNPQIALSFGLGSRAKLGIAMVGPHSVGKQEWPESLEGPRGPQPAPNRFALVHEDTVLVFPTVSIGFAVSDTFSIGGGFTAGIFRENATIFTEGVSPAPAAGAIARDDFFGHQELKTALHASDYFFPGAVGSMLWSPTRTLDVGAWFKVSTPVKPDAELTMESRYWTAAGLINTQPCAAGEPAGCNITDPDGVEGKGEEAVPAEVRAGVRYHRPRDPSAPSTGDGLAEDRYDFEIDVAWANNSVVQIPELVLGSAANLPIRGVSGTSTLPESVGIVKHWKDIVSVRIGGEYVLVPNRFAVQAGGFFESKGQEDVDLHIHFDLARKSGFSGGFVTRMTPRADIYVAYQRIFWADIDNKGKGGTTGLSGDPASLHETRQPINGGLLTSSMNEVAAGITWRF